MRSKRFDRRAVLAGLGLAGLAPVALAKSAAAPAVDHVEIEVGSRKVALFIWRAENARGLVVFSHGAGADPQAYGRLLTQWQAAGLTVVAPVHVDSLSHPDHARYTLASAFMPRYADVSASLAYARKTFPGLKVAAAGHSYGSLFAEMMAGALPAMFGAPNAPVDAVVAFSSPGKIQPLIRADSFASVTVPLLVLTGDHDVVLGAVEDWHDHLYAYETAPAGVKYAWVGQGVDHLYGGAIDRAPSAEAQNAPFAEASALSTLFLRAYVEKDAAALRDLANRTDTPLGHFSRR